MKNQQYKIDFIQICIACVFLLFTPGCKQPATFRTPPGYDLSKPQIYEMPAELNEISGIVFKNGVADTMFAVQDEDGKLYQLHLDSRKISHIKFAKKGDYEDVAFCNGVVIILRSDGGIITFLANNAEREEPEKVNELDDLVPGGEYESIYADEKNNLLYVLCKDCNGKNSKSLSGYILKVDQQGNPERDNEFSINDKEIERLSGIKKINLKASAMAKNIATQEWYIVSSVNKLLVVTDNSWNIKNTYPLSPASVFTQPEGIAFDSNGNLYISNEKGQGNSATVLKFSYQGK